MPKEKDEKVIGLMRDELGGKIITEFVGLRTKTYSYLITTATKKNKTKGTKKCHTERE